MFTAWNSPELVSYPPDIPEVKGWQALKDSFTKTLASMGGTMEMLETNYKVLGDAVMGWGKWRFTMQSPEGETMVVEGRYTDVKAQRDGKWVYIMDHASVPMPPPAEEE